MWTQIYDLHSHSTHSDGEHPVAKVADLMKGQGVECWSLTDHDTTSGWSEAMNAASSRGLRFVPGVEITCEPALPPQREPSEGHRAGACLSLVASAGLLPQPRTGEER